MHSPPPAEGSSRAVGGILRGNARGNVFNLADASEQATSVDLGTRRGTVGLYFSDENPRNVTIGQPSMTLKINVQLTLKPVLNAVEKKYPAIKGENYLLYYIYICFLMLLQMMLYCVSLKMIAGI